MKTAAQEDRGTVENFRASGHHEVMSDDDTVREWPVKPPQAPGKLHSYLWRSCVGLLPMVSQSTDAQVPYTKCAAVAHIRSVTSSIPH